jgi:hypothetical protein
MEEDEMSFVDEIKAICEKRVYRVRKQALHLGLEMGLRLGLHQALVCSYQARFGTMPEPLRETVDAIEDEHTLLAWVPLFTTGSIEDIAAAVLGTAAPQREPAR